MDLLRSLYRNIYLSISIPIPNHMTYNAKRKHQPQQNHRPLNEQETNKLNLGPKFVPTSPRTNYEQSKS